MDALRLRFPQRTIPDLLLSQGVHAVGLDAQGQPAPVSDPATASVQLCVDRRGVWVQVCDGSRGLHLNGRPVRRMAMLRGGDSIYLEGVEMLLLGAEPLAAPSQDCLVRDKDCRTVLRGVGGHYHGHSFSLHQRLSIGRSSDCEISLDEPSLGERHVRLEPHAEGAVLRDLGTGEGSIVNGHPVRDALLRPGDQVVFAARQRFVIEAPTRGAAQSLVSSSPEDDDLSHEGRGAGLHADLPASVRRMPWLLLAALLLAGGLSLLLLYGAR